MQCHVCGTSLPRGASTCPRCGALLSSSNSDYDAIPYIEAQVYVKQVVPSVLPVSSTTVQKTVLSSDEEKSIATSPEQKAPSSQRVPGWMTALLVLLALLLILGGIGSVVYAVNFRPADLHTQATTVAQNFLTAQAQGTVQAGAYATATVNAMTPQQVYQQATSGTPVIDDPLKDDSGSVWYNYNTSPAFSCGFQASAYHIQASASGSSMCTGYGTEFNNLAFQAQIKIIKGQIGGLAFRVGTTNSANDSYYLCLISTNGYYAFNVVNSQQAKILADEKNTAIITGQNQSNLVTVVARNSNIYLYINNHFVKIVTDATYTSGQIAFMAASNIGSFDVAFNNVKVWKL